MNNVNLIGNLVRDVEIRKTNSGKNVASFTIAVNKYNDEVDFINCIAWEQRADVLAKYTSKGTKIGVTGSIQTGSYEHKDGHRVYTTDIVAHQVHLIDNRKQEPTNRVDDYVEQEQQSGPTLDITDMSDLPF